MRYTEKDLKTKYDNFTDYLSSIIELLILSPFRLINEISKKVVYLEQKALKSIVHLSYISHRMKFYKKIRLDYSKYPNMGQVSEILLIFTSKITKSEELKKINSIIVILSQIDAKTAKMRNAMGYRFLRIFVVILLNGNISHASVIADFILNQFIIEG